MKELQRYQRIAATDTAYEGWEETDEGHSICEGCDRLRQEVKELRIAMEVILPMMYPHSNALNAAVAAATLPSSSQQCLSSILSQNYLRKRTTIAAAAAALQQPQQPQQQQLLVQPQQPECPLGVRTVLNPFPAPLQTAFFQWMMPPLCNPSTSGPLTIPLTEGQQLPVVDEQGVKWSSPSSVESNGQKTDSSTVSAADSQTIDIVGDGNESSSTSQASAQEVLTLLNAVAQQNALANVIKSEPASMFFQTAPVTTTIAQQPTESLPVVRLVVQQPTTNASKQSSAGPERKPRVHNCRKKTVSDDIVKIVRQQDLSAEAIEVIDIPVLEATQTDQLFRAVSEQQIIQQIIQGKKYEEMEVGECMIQLCKKLAEKRVFGPRLMSQTTVAGPNHSTYANLPIKGICYIQHVCWKVLRERFNSDEDFWDKFRDAMRKLAARCRRVRHAKKSKHNREESLAKQEMARLAQETRIPASLTHTIQSLGLTGMRPKPEETFKPIQQPVEVSNLSPEHIEMVLKNMKQFEGFGDNESRVAQIMLHMANTNSTCKDDSLSPI